MCIIAFFMIHFFHYILRKTTIPILLVVFLFIFVLTFDTFVKISKGFRFIIIVICF